MIPSNKMPEIFSQISTVSSRQDWENAFRIYEPKLILHTPHSCRASVASNYITVLPPEVIAYRLTGHTSLSALGYYVKLDSKLLDQASKSQINSLMTSHQNYENQVGKIFAEGAESKLQKAFSQDGNAACSDFGAISFSIQHGGKSFSGIDAVRNRTAESFTYKSTHICPFGDACPEDVRQNLQVGISQKSPCGQCYYSVKTVDHLPRIRGVIRHLSDQNVDLSLHISEAKKHGASMDSLLQVTQERKFVASEIAAWSTSAYILEKMLDDVERRNDFLVQKPEIVSQRLRLVSTDPDSIADLLLRIDEAKAYAEFFTPQLKARINRAKLRILSRANKYDELLRKNTEDYSMLDGFRGTIRWICEMTGMTLEEIDNQLRNPIESSIGALTALEMTQNDD